MPYREPTLTPPRGPSGWLVLWRWICDAIYILWNVFGQLFIFCFWPFLIPFLLVYGPRDFWRGIHEIWPEIR